MPGFAAMVNRIADVSFTRFGEDTVITPPSGDPIATRVVVDRNTVPVGSLGDVVDARPSAHFLVADVGVHPRGTFAADGGNWRIGRPMEAGRRIGRVTEGGTDGQVVTVWIEPIP